MMDKTAVIKMVLDLRRTADSLETANCPACVRNGLLVINPRCTTCSGTGKDSNQAAAAYRAKADLIMRNLKLTETDVTSTVRSGVVYGNMNHTADQATAVNPNAYNRCNRCSTNGRAYCPTCYSVDMGAVAARFETWRYHCAYCHSAVAAEQQAARQATEDEVNRRARESAEKGRRGRGSRADRRNGPSAQSYNNDPGKYWYEKGYRAGKSGNVDTWDVTYDRLWDDAAIAGHTDRFEAGFKSGRRKARGY